MNKLLHQLSLRTKMLMIAGLALTVTAVPEALYVKNAMVIWNQARSESAALAPAAGLLQLMRSTQQHRGQANGVLNGNEAGAADREKAAQALQDQLPALKAAVVRLEDETLNGQVRQQHDDLAALLSAVAQRSLKAPESFARHTRLVEQQSALLYDVAVSSGLVLHPNADGYFLQDVVLRQLPPVAEALAQLRGRGMGLLARHELSAGDRAQLAALAASVRAQAALVDKALSLAIKADPESRALLAPAAEEAARLLREGLAYAESSLIQREAVDEPAAQWWARMTQVIDAQYQLGDRARTALERVIRVYGDDAQRELLYGTGGLLLLMGACLALIVMVGRQVTRAANGALQLAEAVAAGDLTRRVQAEGDDEMARMLRALDGMAQQLAGTVASVRDNATQVATASAQIAQGNMDLSGRTEQQASALQQTAASVEELSATVQQTADNAREASAQAVAARDVATRGGQAVDAMVATMKQIDDSSRRIGDIIGTIDGIAFQTNILALNAAVEAARAGEQGRGFAVVAGEVRSLAQRSAQAAREVRTLVSASVERAETGSAQADRAGGTMHEIVDAIDRVSALMQSISGASSEQSRGVAQVDQAMGEIDRATQQNAALVEESAAAAESLRRQAEALQASVSTFRLAAG